MPIDFDPPKSARNVAKGRLPFDAVERFVCSESIIGVSKDQKHDTSSRFFAIGRLDELLHTVFFNIGEQGVRVIGLRRADKPERKIWHASRP